MPTPPPWLAADAAVGRALRRVARNPRVVRVRRLVGVPKDPPHHSLAATTHDLAWCYRIFFGRHPDPAGWEFWSTHIAAGGVALRALTHAFVQSEEFRRSGLLHAIGPDPSTAERLDLDAFTIYVDPEDSVIGAPIAEHGEYEPHVVAALETVLRPGMTFVDVGANIGFISLTAAVAVGSTGRVLAFEPNPGSCALLERSAAENGFDHVEVHQVAVAARAETFVLEVHGSNGRILSVDAVGGTAAAEPERIPCVQLVRSVALDEELPRLGVSRVDVLKIDIEGYEAQALRGMVDTIRRHRPVLFTEWFPDAIRSTSRSDPEAYLDELRSLGYDLAVIDTDGVRQSVRSNAEVHEALATSGSDHLDLLATPVADGGRSPIN